MSIYRDLKVIISGQVPGDYNERDYDVVLAKLRVIAAEYGLDVEIL